MMGFKFFVGWLIVGEDCFKQSFPTRYKNMFAWINETAGDRWSLEPESCDEILELRGTVLKIFVVYEDPAHAVLHKLRWG